MVRRNNGLVIIAFLAGMVLGQLLAPEAIAGGSTAEPVNRIAKSLDDISTTLDKIEKKIK